MKRAAVYMRVSTAGQEEEQTIEGQWLELEQRVKDDGNILLPECIYKDDGWTGGILERPELDRLRVDARNGIFEILYVYDRGRLARLFFHQEIVIYELRECGIEFISLHDINGTTPEEKAMGGMMGVFYEFERVKIAERMRLGKIRKVRENKKLLGYQPKYGYDYHPIVKKNGEKFNGYFTINKVQAGVVHQIYEWYAYGESKHEIKRKLYKLGILPPKGKRPQWSGGTLDRMLSDTTYIGEHYYNKSESVPTKNPRNPEQKYRKVTKGSRKARPKEEWMMVEVPRIIEKELWARVQYRRELDKKTNPRNTKKNQYLCAGLIVCSCGKARTGDPANNSSYYRCTDRLSHYPAPRQCNERGINAPVFDALVWKQLEKLITDPKLVRKYAEKWLSDTSPLENQSKVLNHHLKNLDEEERRYTKAYGQGLMSERLYKDHARELIARRSQITLELSNLGTELAKKPSLPLDELLDETLKLLRNFDFTDKKRAVKELVTKVVATQKEAIIWGRIPVLATENIGLNDKYSNCRTAECRQKYLV